MSKSSDPLNHSAKIRFLATMTNSWLGFYIKKQGEQHLCTVPPAVNQKRLMSFLTAELPPIPPAMPPINPPIAIPMPGQMAVPTAIPAM